jgi:sporulation protein YlmC with PRC-barrel domain
LNPNNLKVEGWHCIDQFSKNDLVLLSSDVREFIPQGLAVDNFEKLSEANELIRLQEVLELRFELIGKPVITDSKRRVGKVSDYAMDTSSFFVKKFYVSQPVYKTLSGGQLSIDRTQIVEITNKRVLVRDVDEKIGSIIPAILGAQ